MCGPGRSVGSRSQLTASWPRAINASRTMPENSQATSTRLVADMAGALKRLGGRHYGGQIARPVSPDFAYVSAAQGSPAAFSQINRPLALFQAHTAVYHADFNKTGSGGASGHGVPPVS